MGLMTTTDIINLRLINQQIAATKLKTPQQLVTHMGAMQSQLFAMAKWAIGLRLPGITDTAIEKDFNDSKILRTHLMRPTWHFVAPADIYWIQSLTAHRVIAIMKRYYDHFGLTTSVRTRSKDVFAKALQGNNFLTRDELKAELKKAKIIAEKERLAHIVMDAELHNIICSGPQTGNQFTYALLEERAPKAKTLPHDEALAELTRRYFTSRGPATLRDFVWWSGLTAKEANEGIAMLGRKFVHEKIDGREYIFIPGSTILTKTSQTTFLMPDYDEYIISYKDRNIIKSLSHIPPANRNGDVLANHMFVINGIMEGTWNPAIKNKKTPIETIPFISLKRSDQQKLNNATKRYISFLR